MLSAKPHVYDTIIPLYLTHDHTRTRSRTRTQSIIFIRDRNAKGQEVSGYIDFAHRLKAENFEPYFEGRKKVRTYVARITHAYLSTLCAWMGT
jgi:hypothetical protein